MANSPVSSSDLSDGRCAEDQHAASQNPELLRLYQDYESEFAVDRAENFTYDVVQTARRVWPFALMAAVGVWGFVVLVLGAGGPQ